MSKEDLALKSGVPHNLDAERMALGAVLHDNSYLPEIERLVSASDFYLEKHRRVFRVIQEIHSENKPIDRITLCDGLMKYGHLESVGGISYVASLDEGMPDLVNPGSYASIVRDKSVLRRFAMLGTQISQSALMPDSSPASMQAEVESAMASISQGMAGDKFAERVSETIDEIGIDGLLNPATRETGIETGFHRLDDMTAGFQKQELTIIAARPSVGKSSLMINIAMKVADLLKKAVVIFSMEMSRRNLIERMVCSHAKMNLLRLRSGVLQATERERLAKAAHFVHGLPIYTDDASAQTHQQISSKVDRLRREHGVELVFIDYVQQMGFEMKKGAREKNENDRLTEIAEALKGTAKRQNVAMVALSQLSRAPEQRTKDHRPVLSDLRSSGGLEQAADLVLFPYREFMYNPQKKELENEAEIIIGKARNGPVGVAHVAWHKDWATFDNAPDRYQEARTA